MSFWSLDLVFLTEEKNFFFTKYLKVMWTVLIVSRDQGLETSFHDKAGTSLVALTIVWWHTFWQNQHCLRSYHHIKLANIWPDTPSLLGHHISTLYHRMDAPQNKKSQMSGKRLIIVCLANILLWDTFDVNLLTSNTKQGHPFLLLFFFEFHLGNKLSCPIPLQNNFRRCYCFISIIFVCCLWMEAQKGIIHLSVTIQSRVPYWH